MRIKIGKSAPNPANFPTFEAFAEAYVKFAESIRQVPLKRKGTGKYTYGVQIGSKPVIYGAKAKAIWEAHQQGQQQKPVAAKQPAKDQPAKAAPAPKAAAKKTQPAAKPKPKESSQTDDPDLKAMYKDVAKHSYSDLEAAVDKVVASNDLTTLKKLAKEMNVSAGLTSKKKVADGLKKMFSGRKGRFERGEQIRNLYDDSEKQATPNYAQIGGGRVKKEPGEIEELEEPQPKAKPQPAKAAPAPKAKDQKPSPKESSPKESSQTDAPDLKAKKKGLQEETGKKPPSSSSFSPEEESNLLDIVGNWSKKNPTTQVPFPKLYEAVAAKDKGMSVEDFKKEISRLADEGKLRLFDYGRPQAVFEKEEKPEFSIPVDYSRNGLYYAQLGKKGPQEQAPSGDDFDMVDMPASEIQKIPEQEPIRMETAKKDERILDSEQAKAIYDAIEKDVTKIPHADIRSRFNPIKTLTRAELRKLVKAVGYTASTNDSKDVMLSKLLGSLEGMRGSYDQVQRIGSNDSAPDFDFSKTIEEIRKKRPKSTPNPDLDDKRPNSNLDVSKSISDAVSKVSNDSATVMKQAESIAPKLQEKLKDVSPEVKEAAQDFMKDQTPGILAKIKDTLGDVSERTLYGAARLVGATAMTALGGVLGVTGAVLPVALAAPAAVLTAPLPEVGPVIFPEVFTGLGSLMMELFRASGRSFSSAFSMLKKVGKGPDPSPEKFAETDNVSMDVVKKLTQEILSDLATKWPEFAKKRGLKTK